MNFSILLAELFGTAILVFLGNGAVANISLEGSGGKGNSGVVALAWGFAVMIPAFIFGSTSGAHFNPAVTIAMSMRSGDWSNLPSYLIGQVVGALLGAMLVYLMFQKQFEITEDAAAKLGCFCTSPSIESKFHNFLSEFVETFILVLALMGMGNIPGLNSDVSYIIVYSVIAGMICSTNGLTGTAMNPVRDLCPRIIHQIFHVGPDSHWEYAWNPIIAPICGAVCAALFYVNFPWL